MALIPVLLQSQDPTTEAWTDVKTLHALRVNKSTKTRELLAAGAEQTPVRLVFDFRWRKLLEAVAHNPQIYRLVYRGYLYNIIDHDDYMETHDMITLTGEQYGGYQS